MSTKSLSRPSEDKMDVESSSVKDTTTTTTSSSAKKAGATAPKKAAASAAKASNGGGDETPVAKKPAAKKAAVKKEPVEEPKVVEPKEEEETAAEDEMAVEKPAKKAAPKKKAVVKKESAASDAAEEPKKSRQPKQQAPGKRAGAKRKRAEQEGSEDGANGNADDESPKAKRTKVDNSDVSFTGFIVPFSKYKPKADADDEDKKKPASPYNKPLKPTSRKTVEANKTKTTLAVVEDHFKELAGCLATGEEFDADRLNEDLEKKAHQLAAGKRIRKDILPRYLRADTKTNAKTTSTHTNKVLNGVNSKLANTSGVIGFTGLGNLITGEGHLNFPGFSPEEVRRLMDLSLDDIAAFINDPTSQDEFSRQMRVEFAGDTGKYKAFQSIMAYILHMGKERREEIQAIFEDAKTSNRKPCTLEELKPSDFAAMSKNGFNQSSPKDWPVMEYLMSKIVNKNEDTFAETRNRSTVLQAENEELRAQIAALKKARAESD